MGDRFPLDAPGPREHPEAFLLAFTVTLFMTSIYESSTPLALQAGGLLIGVSWYFATGSAGTTVGSSTVSDREHHLVKIEFKCPMPDCGLKQTANWMGYELPSGLEGVSIGDTLEGPFHCPDCEDQGVAHSGLFEVTDVGGEPVNTDYDPRALTDGGTSGSGRIEAVRVYRDGSWKFKDDGGWTPLTDHEPRSPSGSLLKRLYSWAWLCVQGGDYTGIDRRRNRPAAYYSEVEAGDVDG